MSTKINFLGPATAGWDGVFHAKGWGSKSARPPSKVCFPWVFEGRNLRCPENVAGMSWTPGGVQEVHAKKFVLFFSQDTFDHDKGQKPAISRRRLHWIYLNFLQWIFSFLSRFCL